MTRSIIFIVVSCFFLRVSRRSLHNPGSHGFYRFFVFEGVLLLALLNQPYWFVELLTPLHLLSWCFLAVSVCFIVQSLWLLKRRGGHAEREDMPENHSFENTVNVVKEGLYSYIRHPMYSSLLFLAWGAYLKNISFISSTLIAAVMFFLFIAAKVEEGENIRFFGQSYREYIEQSKMFVPFIF
ncbi:MAG: isoprenylcysteine carboxylmethyltransferase family protein [Desulfocapsa sp.]|nr:MAG: isoprenylcysteine carboxylmethyltransferase family protein [Desulfocapsa sp.]